MIPVLQDLDRVICLFCSAAALKFNICDSSQARDAAMFSAASPQCCLKYNAEIMLSTHWLFTIRPSPQRLTSRDLWLAFPYTFKPVSLLVLRHSSFTYLSAFRFQLSCPLTSLLHLFHIVNSICLKPDSPFPSRVASLLPLFLILWVMSLKKRIHHLGFLHCLYSLHM